MAANDSALLNMQRLAGFLMQKICVAAMQDTMNFAEDVCKATTSFQDESGALRKSIKAGIEKVDADTITGALAAGYPEFKNDRNPTSFYVGLVELGHGGPQPAPPHPYIRPTMQTVMGAGILPHNIIMHLLSEFG